jgi:hypothetical protein
MKLSSEWFDRTPEYHGKEMRKLNKGTINAEADCECGIEERHRHCSHCGMLYASGDWEAPSLSFTIQF